MASNSSSDPDPAVAKYITEHLREEAARENAQQHRLAAARGITDQDPPDLEEINRILGGSPY